jgi:hypothetical protein
MLRPIWAPRDCFQLYPIVHGPPQEERPSLTSTDGRANNASKEPLPVTCVPDVVPMTCGLKPLAYMQFRLMERVTLHHSHSRDHGYTAIAAAPTAILATLPTTLAAFQPAAPPSKRKKPEVPEEPPNRGGPERLPPFPRLDQAVIVIPRVLVVALGAAV